MNSIPLHDPKCKLCRPALKAIKLCSRVKLKGKRPMSVKVQLSPDVNAFGVFMGFHVSLIK